MTLSKSRLRSSCTQRVNACKQRCIRSAVAGWNPVLMSRSPRVGRTGPGFRSMSPPSNRRKRNHRPASLGQEALWHTASKRRKSPLHMSTYQSGRSLLGGSTAMSRDGASALYYDQNIREGHQDKDYHLIYKECSA